MLNFFGRLRSGSHGVFLRSFSEKGREKAQNLETIRQAYWILVHAFSEHEPPYIVKGNKMEMREGMTFTVEPGIYLPGEGGVRIEDNVVVTGGGLEKLTSYPTELRIL